MQLLINLMYVALTPLPSIIVVAVASVWVGW